MFKKFVSRINKKNALWKVSFLSSYIQQSEKILDFGCGDLSFAKALKSRFSKSEITGVDVLAFNQGTTEIPFVLYSGKRLPFKNNSFDTVIAFYVLHHCKDPQYALQECLRVAKKRVIFVEPVWRVRFEIIFMKYVDIFFNAVKSLDISPPSAFYSLTQWYGVIKKQKAKVISIKKMKQNFLPADLSIGVPYIFEIAKQKEEKSIE